MIANKLFDHFGMEKPTKMVAWKRSLCQDRSPIAIYPKDARALANDDMCRHASCLSSFGAVTRQNSTRGRKRELTLAVLKVIEANKLTSDMTSSEVSMSPELT
jgi:hypothetical protein